MRSPSTSSLEQLLRQREWLKDSWTWLLRSKVLQGKDGGARPTALDVGCGPGLLMELFSSMLDARGLDIDPGVVETCNNRGQKAIVGKAEELPFEDNSFDIVYCSYLLLWTPDPVRVLKEMKRVSRDWVICLAEPDHYGRISHPPGIWLMDEYFTRGLKKQGADPGMGRTLQAAFTTAGMSPEVGVHAGMWKVARMRAEAEDEFYSLASIASEATSQVALSELKKEWDRAARDGSLVQFTPTFWAMARK